MLLAIDVGNTNIVFALYDGEAQKKLWRCTTESGRTADEYASWLYPLFNQSGYDFQQIERIIISSVVPEANNHLSRLGRETFGCVPLVLDQHMIDMVIDVDKPQEVGADRLVNALAVQLEYNVPAIVIDFGTATTFDVINGNGHYMGGVIAPGVNLSVEALYQAAAKLPRINVDPPKNVIGRDTVSAMQSGVYWAYIAMIEGMVERIKNEMGCDAPLVLATGGLAQLFEQGCSVIDKVDQELTLKGLVYIDRNHVQSLNEKNAA